MPSIDDKKQPIVIKKIKKGGGGHHGGSWKVAYADFVTAMMAFFLLMWLLGSTTDGEKAGIAEFFKQPSATQGPGGASTSMIQFGGAMDVPRSSEGTPFKQHEVKPDELLEALADKARLDDLLADLLEQIEQSSSLRDFKDQLLLDITSEGLRIQIVDKENRPMFDLGGTQLKWYTVEILHELAKTIEQVPNRVSIAGHTDATPYHWSRKDYTNWELSADRANAARRELKIGGLSEAKFGRVVGLSDSVLFDRENPFNPINRRISIIVLNRATERAIGLMPSHAPGSTIGTAPAPENAETAPAPVEAGSTAPPEPLAPAPPPTAPASGLEEELARELAP